MTYRRIKLTLEFDGSDFHGWQIQAVTGERTVQGVLEEVLKTIPLAKPRMIGAGRTDAGVHALAMVAHYDTKDNIPIDRIPKVFNSRLPEDVRVLKAEEVGEDFEAQFSCKYRHYIYKMRLARACYKDMALERKYLLFLPQLLDVTAMQKAAPYFEGKRDFVALATQETRSTIKEVCLCQIRLKGNDIRLDIVADGFLRGMVRTIVGTLIYVGEGKIKSEEIPSLLADKDRNKLGPKAPPQGLYFAEAGYHLYASNLDLNSSIAST